MKKIYIIIILLFTTVVSCDLDRDLYNPNQPLVSAADPDLLMNSVQIAFSDFFSTTSTSAGKLMRMEAMISGFNYGSANQPTSTDALWRRAYEGSFVTTTFLNTTTGGVLNTIELLLPIAESKKLTTHVAVAKILKAYTYITLVDLFNDVPQSEAAKRDNNYNPKADKGEDVYKYAIGLLQEAKQELDKTGADAGGALSRDNYYNGDRKKWKALANTLELKAWVNISMISSRATEAQTQIDALLGSDLVDTEAENFTYKYGTETVPANSRHPLYDQYYLPDKGSANGYIGNYFLYQLFGAKGVQDPRWRYYFFRQVGSISQALSIDPKSVGCSKGSPPVQYDNNENKVYFCTFDPGFYGRDHGDGSGTPPDSPVITCAGVYPAGGALDTNPTTNRTFSKSTVRGDGANGAGIQPIWMSFYTDFLKAEILTRKGQDAKSQLATAIQNSITQVRNFASGKGLTLPSGLEPSTSAYQAAVAKQFDLAANKMDVVGKEFYVSLWGNGLEAYNLYRRTSAPRDIAPLIQVNPDAFHRSFILPSLYVNLNSNASTQKVTDKVFWDTNADDLK